MEYYDPRKIGKLIAWFGEHFVYRYGEDEVIKLSRLTSFLGSGEIAYLQRDIEIGKRYYGPYMLRTRIATLPDGSRPALIQSFVHGRTLRMEDLQNPDIARQYRDVVARHRRMLQDGHPDIDLMSGKGFLTGSMRNIFLLAVGEISLIDVTSIEILPLPLRRLGSARQNRIIDRFLRAAAV